ncbi:MAG: DUF2489 domain-containing protein [Methylobacter sp.]|nr:MAG: DUF2489 domain-containing protein [Methylobacter sp.]
MTVVVTNEQCVASIRDRVVLIALAMLNDEMDFLEGSIQLVSMRHDVAVEENDPDFRAFVGIASEIDGLPIGPSKKYWSNKALIRHQPQVDAATVWAKQFGTIALHSIVRRFRT